MSKFSSVVSKHKSNQKLTDQYYHAMIASYDSLRCRGKLDCISVIMYHQYLITMEQLKTIVEDLLDYGPNNQYHIDVELYNSYMNFLKVQDAYSLRFAHPLRLASKAPGDLMKTLTVVNET